MTKSELFEQNEKRYAQSIADLAEHAVGHYAAPGDRAAAQVAMLRAALELVEGVAIPKKQD